MWHWKIHSVKGQLYQNKGRQWLLRDKFIVSEDPDYLSEYVTLIDSNYVGFYTVGAGEQPSDEEQ